MYWVSVLILLFLSCYSTELFVLLCFQKYCLGIEYLIYQTIEYTRVVYHSLPCYNKSDIIIYIFCFMVFTSLCRFSSFFVDVFRKAYISLNPHL